MLDFDELATVDDPAWPELDGLFAASPVPLTVLPVDAGEARRGLLQLQVTARSVLGAVALNSGGLLLDGGWVRVFGGGAGADQALPSLAQVNGFPAAFDPAWSPAVGLIVGHDVVGGVFALNGVDAAAAGPAWETAALAFSQGISVIPRLWSKEGGNLAATSRRAVPMREVLGVAADFARQMGADPGFLGRA